VLNPFIPIVDTDRFMRLHNRASVDFDLTLPNVSRLDHMPTVKGCTKRPGRDCTDDLGTQSHFHGFDLACKPDWWTRVGAAGEEARLSTEARAYYPFDVPVPAGKRKRRTVRFVVLNTAEIVPDTIGEGFDRRSRANMLPEQIRWLEHTLDK